MVAAHTLNWQLKMVALWESPVEEFPYNYIYIMAFHSCTCREWSAHLIQMELFELSCTVDKVCQPCAPNLLKGDITFFQFQQTWLAPRTSQEGREGLLFAIYMLHII